MSGPVERKTLSMPGTRQTTSKIQEIEKDLKASTRKALDDYIKGSPIASTTYHQKYGLKNTVRQEIFKSITKAHQELLSTVKFPTQAQKTLEIMAQKVYRSLQVELGDHAHHACKFDRVYKEFLLPKPSPKVLTEVPDSRPLSYRR